MAKSEERICNPISRGELERRRAAARAAMDAAGIDAFVFQGAGNLAGIGGYHRWFTGMAAPSSYPHSVIFPRDGLMTVIHHGAFGGDAALSGDDPYYPGIGRRLTAPSFPSVSYTGGYDAELAAAAVKEAGYRKLGLLGAGTLYHSFGAGLARLLPEVEFVDASDLVDPLRAAKSAEEIALVRAAAAMQDEIFARIGSHIRPGMRDFELTAYGQYLGQTLGSESGYFLGSSAPPGEPATLRLRPHQGRTIEEGDVVLFQAENSGPGGMFVHLARYFVLGKAPQELADGFAVAVEAQEESIRLLRQGMSCSALFAEYNAYLRGRGLPAETRLATHGQGYDSVERPLIRSDETLRLAGTLNIGSHPSFGDRHIFVTVCDNFLLHENGDAERLHKTPRAIVEL